MLWSPKEWIIDNPYGYLSFFEMVFLFFSQMGDMIDILKKCKNNKITEIVVRYQKKCNNLKRKNIRVEINKLKLGVHILEWA